MIKSIRNILLILFFAVAHPVRGSIGYVNSSYTKHYYAGTERLATAIGQGGLDTMIHPIDSLTRQDIKEYHKPFHEYYSRRHPFRYHHTIGDVITTETIDGQQINNLQYQCSPLELDRMDVLLSSRNIVLLPMTYYSQNRGIENKIIEP